MQLLAVDASSRGFSVALDLGHKVISENHHNEQVQQSQQILNVIDNILRCGQLDLSSLACIAFGCGPGSFTGVRLITSIVQALAYARNISLVPVSSLQVLAQSAYRLYRAKQVLVVTNAHMQEVFYGVYKWSQEHGVMLNVKPDSLAKRDDLKSLILEGEWQGIGDGWVVFEKQLELIFEKNLINIFSEPKQPEAVDIISLAKYYYRQGELKTAWTVEPVYLRDSGAWRKSSD